jgi:tetratricopeptide (TPR) repeat protein
MPSDDILADLPEAIPLTRVAPFWRILAVLALIGMAGLLLSTLVLGSILLEKNNAPGNAFNRTQFAPAGAPRAPINQAPAGVPNSQLPYPVQQDLARSDILDLADEKPLPEAARKGSSRQQFLDLSQERWLAEPGTYTNHVAVSPNGDWIAFLAGGQLHVKPTRQLPGGHPGAQPLGGNPNPNVNHQTGLVGIPAFAGLAPYLYCTDSEGAIRRFVFQPAFPAAVRFSMSDGQVVFNGELPTCVPWQNDKLVFVRTQPVAKVEVPGAPAATDQTEVVLGDLQSRAIKVLVPASTASWRSLTVSPDGQKLALVSDLGNKEKRPTPVRVFLMDLIGGQPRPLTPPALNVSEVAWTPDSKGLVYGRSQDPLPPDYWEEEDTRAQNTTDLFLWNLTTNQELRLSRGGGFFSPSLTNNERLNYLMWRPTPDGQRLELRSMPLADARTFARSRPEPVRRDAAAWTGVFDQVLQTAKVPANATGEQLTPDAVTRLVNAFDHAYQERFRAAPPSTWKGLARLREELQALSLPLAVRPRLVLVLGVVEGNYLVYRHGARWHLSKGPLLSPRKAGALSMREQNLFGVLVNPFEEERSWAHAIFTGDEEEDEEATSGQGLWALLHESEGRPIILANDPAEGRKALATLIDPDLARAQALLHQHKGMEAGQILLAMLKQKQHARNTYLALQVGKLLFDYQRLDALSTLMEQRCRQSPPDAHQLNLLGLALMPRDLHQAIEEFKKALRCNLYFGPAYFNLAEAYQRTGDRFAAEMCLRRYLELMPYGPYAIDARQRLAAMEEPAGPPAIRAGPGEPFRPERGPFPVGNH